MKIVGGCVCGGMRYELRAVPGARNDCHCVDCRRSSGAPFVTWGSVRRGDLVVMRGQLNEIRHADRIRSFAHCCGTPVFFTESKDSDWVDVTIASLDDPSPFPPEMSIWTEDKLPWIILDPSLPSFPRSSSGETA